MKCRRMHIQHDPSGQRYHAAVMPIELTEDEKSYSSAPVNYRFERLVAERASINPKAEWFVRSANEEQSFPKYMVSEDWQEEEGADLCQTLFNTSVTAIINASWSGPRTAKPVRN